MSWKKYTVEGHEYTADEDVLFGDLTNKGNVTIPGTFDSVPFVTIISHEGIKAKAKDISTTGFRLERSRGSFGNLSKTGTFNFRIFGES